MSDTEFKVSQRRWLVGWSAFSFALALGALLDVVTGARILRGDVTVVFILWGVFAGPYLLDLASGRTVLLETSVSTSSLFRRRSCRWDQIQRIELMTSRGRGSTSTWIVIYPATGKSFTLRAPFSTRRVPDRYFNEALSQIKSRHIRRAHRLPD